MFPFSAVDAASAVDYSKGNIEDGVVNSPPATLAQGDKVHIESTVQPGSDGKQVSEVREK